MNQKLTKNEVTQFAEETLERIETDKPALGAIREGLPYIGGGLVGALLLNLLFPRLGKIFWLLPAAILFFFRDPPRAYQQDETYLYAAADGTVISVDEVEEQWFLEGPATRIVTFLSVLNVHVNRSPVAGRILKTTWKPGTFTNAMHLQKSEDNERNLVAINGPRGPVIVVQIAGLIARRIVCWVGQGEAVKAGQKFGMIKFGSRTDVLVPRGAVEVLVEPGQKVRAGITPIARYTSPSNSLR